MKKLTHFPGKLKPEQIASIVRIEGAGSYSILHFTEGKPLVMAYPVKVFAGLLPDFIRIHKQNLINPGQIKDIRFYGPMQQRIEMVTGEEMCMSRRRKDSVLELVASILYPEPALETANG